MKRNKSSHISKSKEERDYYNRMIKNLDFEPTQSESIEFNESNDKDEDYSVQTSNKPRRRPLTHTLTDHFRENMSAYIMSFLGIILFYFMIDSKVDLATIKQKIVGIDEKINNYKEQNKDIKSKVDKNDEKLHQLEIEIIKNSVSKQNPKN